MTKLLSILTLAAVALVGGCALTESPVGPAVDTPTVDRVEADVPSGTEPPVTSTTLEPAPPPNPADLVTDESCYPLITDGVGGCVDPPAGGVHWEEPGLTDESCWPQVSDGVNCVDPPDGGDPAD